MMRQNQIRQFNCYKTVHQQIDRTKMQTTKECERSSQQHMCGCAGKREMQRIAIELANYEISRYNMKTIVAEYISFNYCVKRLMKWYIIQFRCLALSLSIWIIQPFIVGMKHENFVVLKHNRSATHWNECSHCWTIDFNAEQTQWTKERERDEIDWFSCYGHIATCLQ